MWRNVSLWQMECFQILMTMTLLIWAEHCQNNDLNSKLSLVSINNTRSGWLTLPVVRRTLIYSFKKLSFFNAVFEHFLKDGRKQCSVMEKSFYHKYASSPRHFKMIFHIHITRPILILLMLKISSLLIFLEIPKFLALLKF